MANVETLVGGTGNDTITLGSVLTAAMSVDLGAGSNKLTLTAGVNTGTVSNVSTLIGGAGNDAITLGTALAGGSIDLGAGSDRLTLANATNTVTVANVETIIGGTGNDTVTLGSALTNAMSVDLGAGSNKLTLANTRKRRHSQRCRYPDRWDGFRFRHLRGQPGERLRGSRCWQ